MLPKSKLDLQSTFNVSITSRVSYIFKRLNAWRLSVIIETSQMLQTSYSLVARKIEQSLTKREVVGEDSHQGKLQTGGTAPVFFIVVRCLVMGLG